MSSSQTNNYGLHQWSRTDYVEVDEFNSNFAKLDDEVAKKASKADVAGKATKGDVADVGGLVQKKTQGSINIAEYGAVGDGVTNDLAAINRALRFGKDVPGQEEYTTVIFPPGTYKIGGALRIFRKTRIIAHGAHIKRGSYISLLTNINRDDTQTSLLLDRSNPYSGHGDIIIEGGLWDGNIAEQPYVNSGFNGMYFAHAHNVLIKDLTIKDIVTCHGLDLNAVKNFTVDNCNFIGYKDATVAGDGWYPRDFVEAIQVANITDGADGKGYPSEDITIKNCYFGASGTTGTQAWPVGVGNHGGVHDSYNQNIVVSECTLDQLTYAGVRNFKFKNTKLLGNTFRKCYRDISVSNSNGLGEAAKKWDETTGGFVPTGLPQSGMDLVIQGNVFENTRHNVLAVRGQSRDGVIAKFDGVVFEGNVFRRDDGTFSSSNMIDLYLCKNVVIKNPSKMINAYRGLSIDMCSNVSVDGLDIENTTLEALILNEADETLRNQGHTANVHINNVRAKNIKYNGMTINYLKGGSVKDCVIEDPGNLIDNTRYGINVAAYSDNIEIERNTVKSGTGNKNKAGVGISSSASNVRVGQNTLEGKTAPLEISGTTNWAGHYVYDSAGKRYRAVLSGGSTVYTEG